LEFDNGWVTLPFHSNENETPLFQRSGKKNCRLDLSGSNHLDVGASVGDGMASRRHGLLQRRNVPGTRTCGNWTIEHESDRSSAGKLRTPSWEETGGLLDVLLP
jgi:hypothetical protein